MSVNFGHPASWALGLGVVGGAIVGTVVPARTPGEELRHIFGFVLLFGPSIYVLIDRQRERWEAKHPYLRFVVFMLSILVASVALVAPVAFLVPGPDWLAQALEFLAGVAAFGVAAWMTFYGGAEGVWERFLERTDTEW